MKLRMAVCLLIGFSLSVAASAHAGVVDVRDVENPARTPFVVTSPWISSLLSAQQSSGWYPLGNGR